MAGRRVGEVRAFETLRTARQLSNVKLRVLADEVLCTGDVS